MTKTGVAASAQSGYSAGAPVDIAAAALPERLATDLAFAGLSRDRKVPSRLLLLAANPVGVWEGLLRASPPISVVAETDEAAIAARIAAAALIPTQEGEIDVFVGNRDRDRWVMRPHDVALWMSPTRDTWRARVRDVDAALAPGAYLAIVGAGPLTRVMSRLRPGGLPMCQGAANPCRVGETFEYQAEGIWRLFGMRSAAFGVLRISADRIGRPDLADRLEAAYRLALLERGTPMTWSVGVWIGRKRHNYEDAATSSGLRSAHR
jgi:hypothetical protein